MANGSVQITLQLIFQFDRFDGLDLNHSGGQGLLHIRLKMIIALAYRGMEIRHFKQSNAAC